ncbi:unnamed protein product [Rhodiola kirilowii]
MKHQLEAAIFHNPTILLLLSLAHSYIFLTKIFLHNSAFVRLISIIPAFYIFLVIPWSFSSALIRSLLSYFIIWITSFKLLAYCFRTGPQVPCATSFLDFATVAIFPVKANDRVPHKNGTTTSRALVKKIQDAAPLAWLIIVLNLYIFVVEKGQISNRLILLFYSTVIVSWLVLTRFMTRYEVVPIFDKPYLSTSLQQFWGKKWNKYSSLMLRLNVYDPARYLLNPLIGTAPARLTATLTTLAVSGMMHEVMLYYITCGKKPTWEASWYFLLQGISMGCESLLKYLWLQVLGKCPIRPVWSILMVDGFVAGSFYVFIIKPVTVSGQNHC